MRLSILMTVFEEANFIEYAIRSCLPYVDDLVIVEGAYLENIKLGKSARSNDGTLNIINRYKDEEKVHIFYANEQSDKDHRNVGLEKIKQLNPDGFLLIIDGDEVYKQFTFDLIKKSIIPQMIKYDKKVRYFSSMTFMNNVNTFCWQQFPRLFKITKECNFINDNQMSYKDNETIVSFDRSLVPSSDKINYFHYSFLKNKKKFEEKRNWWMNRGLGPNFDYGWNIDENGIISDKTNSNHKPLFFTGKHPNIMKSHPLFENL